MLHRLLSRALSDLCALASELRRGVSHAESQNTTLNLIAKELARMNEQLEALRAQVAQTNGVVDSAVTLIRGFADQVASAAGEADAEALKALAADMKTHSDALAAAVASVPPANPATTAAATEQTPGSVPPTPETTPSV